MWKHPIAINLSPPQRRIVPFRRRRVSQTEHLRATIKRTHLTGTMISMQISLSARILIQLSKLNSARDERGRNGHEPPSPRQPGKERVRSPLALSRSIFKPLCVYVCVFEEEEKAIVLEWASTYIFLWMRAPFDPWGWQRVLSRSSWGWLLSLEVVGV